MIVTQCARDIQKQSLQLKHDQQAYYALTSATPPGQNQPASPLATPVDAHFMIESVGLISDFFNQQIEGKTA